MATAQPALGTRAGLGTLWFLLVKSTTGQQSGGTGPGRPGVASCGDRVSAVWRVRVRPPDGP